MNVFLSTIFVYMAEKKLLKKSFFKRTVFLGSFFNLNAYMLIVYTTLTLSYMKKDIDNAKRGIA